MHILRELIFPFFIILLMGVLSGCGAVSGVQEGIPATLTVFAAASLAESMQAMADRFEDAHPGVEVSLNLAGSQQLVQQLGSGAAADVFASADAAQMQAAEQLGRMEPGAARPLARNRLVVITPPDNPGNIHSLEDLANPGVRLVLAAKEVPAGKYTLELLQRLGSDDEKRVLANVASYEESVRFVLAKVLLGEADAGIVYTTDAASEPGDKLGRIEIDEALNPAAVYLIAPVGDAQHPELAQAFVELALSPEGQAILQEHGFLPAEEE